jgi:hypothetical protein
MATLVHSAAIGGSVLGISAATIGGMFGSRVGAVLDGWIVSSYRGPREPSSAMDATQLT